LLKKLVISDYSDLYAFWHSSQRNDPGLNITGYANITTDNILEDLRGSMESNEDIENFISEIRNDIPAIFLYAPKFIYVSPDNIEGLNINKVISSKDRFVNIHEWFIETDKVWEVFAN
jgi:peptide/nickel transport system substrate-binding protein